MTYIHVLDVAVPAKWWLSHGLRYELQVWMGGMSEDRLRRTLLMIPGSFIVKRGK